MHSELSLCSLGKLMADKSPSDIVLEALENLEQPTTPSEIVRYARKKYPQVDEGRIRSQVTISCVNMPTRVSFPENQRPRLATDPSLDSLYRIDFGQYVKYDPAVHELWEIADVEGELTVRKAASPQPAAVAPTKSQPLEVPAAKDQPEAASAQPSAKIHGKAKLVETEDAPKPVAPHAPAAPSAPPVVPVPPVAAKKEPPPQHQPAPPKQPAEAQVSDNMPQGDLEKKMEQSAQLHEILADRLHEVEEGLKAHSDPGIMSKFPVPLSPSDILALDPKGGIVILKVFTEPPGHQFITDLLVNIGWANENMGGKEVRAIVLSPVIPNELRFAAKSIPGVKLATYEYKLVFSPIK